jgi:hypothetical protein
MTLVFTDISEYSVLPIFIRLVFFAWGLHFYDLSTQALCCGGSKGLSPVHVQIKAAKLATKSKWKRFMKIKTIFWLNDDDWFIQLVPRLGILSSILGMVGYFSNVMFAINFIIYHSIDCIFWDGMQFPWENLMFELGFMSIFSPTLLPYDIHQVIVHPWNSYLIWSYQWLLFRLMFGFGKTKFIDDNVTTDNSLYIYHFLFSQPMIMHQGGSFYGKVHWLICGLLKFHCPFYIFIPILECMPFMEHYHCKLVSSLQDVLVVLIF